MGILLPKSDVMLSSTHAVSNLCKPLESYGITFFSHTRVYPDGGFIDISNDSSMIEYFYYKTDIYKYYEPDMHPENFENNFFLCSTLKNNKAVIACREELNIDNLIVFSEKSTNHYDIWNFGTYRNNDSIINFYLNNIDILKSFTLYFKERAERLIKEFENDRILRPIVSVEDSIINVEDKDVQKKQVLSLQSENNLSLEHSNFLELKKYYIGGKYSDTYLTPAEFKVLCWCVIGKSATEISLILNSKKRTIEGHIENIKAKFRCYSKLSLIKCIYEDSHLKNFINAYIHRERK